MFRKAVKRLSLCASNALEWVYLYGIERNGGVGRDRIGTLLMWNFRVRPLSNQDRRRDELLGVVRSSLAQRESSCQPAGRQQDRLLHLHGARLVGQSHDSSPADWK